jgi:hypothetical protein
MDSQSGFEPRGPDLSTRVAITVGLHCASLMLWAAARLFRLHHSRAGLLLALLYSVITTLHDHDLEPDNLVIGNHPFMYPSSCLPPLRLVERGLSLPDCVSVTLVSVTPVSVPPVSVCTTHVSVTPERYLILQGSLSLLDFGYLLQSGLGPSPESGDSVCNSLSVPDFLWM